MSKKLTSIIRITTKTGDSGTSSLANGERIPKESTYFAAIGDVDELNSWLGSLVAEKDKHLKTDLPILLNIQDTLFYLGAELAQSPQAKLSSEKVAHLENEAGVLEEELTDYWHSNFLFPGGTATAAKIDIARSVCRRAERAVIAHAQQVVVSPVITQYLNRLSDYLYLLRCAVNRRAGFKEKKFVNTAKKPIKK